MSTATVSEGYLVLIRRFPLLPITSDEGLDRAIEVVEELADRDRVGNLDAEERGYFQILRRLISDYEDEHHPMPRVTGTAMARHLMEVQGITQAQVAASTGLPQSALSEVLAGKRTLSTRYVKALAKYFGVSPAMFLED